MTYNQTYLLLQDLVVTKLCSDEVGRWMKIWWQNLVEEVGRMCPGSTKQSKSESKFLKNGPKQLDLVGADVPPDAMVLWSIT